ncbi:MAG: cytidine deaminase [Candidatus Gracilibacteria bacterium]
MSTVHKIDATYGKLTRGELTGEELADLEEALLAREEAYAPYSNYLVGACLRTNDDAVVHGWNVEDISYAALHAEKNAIGRVLQKSRPSGLKRVTVIGGLRGQDAEDIATSCGDCRQALLEVILPEDNPQIIMAGVHGAVIRANLRDLLPLGFFPASIKK